MIEDFSIKLDDPKEPDDTRTWRAMDIYVFSNGQQNTPPRKYHLEESQLEWWSITLTYLAGTQYGTVDREIDLYTIDGTKIEGPLSLKNDYAYVAVQKPDDFIDAGYYKYLVKASKSWEKSQSKRGLNNNKKDNNVPSIVHDAKPEILTESSDVKVYQSVEHSPDDSLLMHTTAQRNSAIGVVEKRKESIKSNDTKRSSIHTPIIRRLSSPASPSSSKRPSIKRKESVKLGNVQITGPANDKKILTRYSSNSSQLERIISTKSKLPKVNNIKNTIPSAELPKVVEDLNEPNISLDQINSNSNDKKYISSPEVAPNNPNEFFARVELLDVVQPEPKKEHSTSSNNFSSSKNVENVSIKEKDVEIYKDNKNFRIDSMATTSDRETIHYNEDISAIPTKDNEEMPVKLDPTFPVVGSTKVKEFNDEKILEDKGLTATNKDDVVIKLHIDIWYHNKDPNRTVVSANCPQFDISKQKESQVNVTDETIPCKRSLPPCACTSIDVNRDDQSVIIVKCLSRSLNEKIQNATCSSKNPNNKGLMFFLPILQLDETATTNKTQCFDEPESTPRQSKISNLKRTTSCLSLLHTVSYYENGETTFGSTLNQIKDPRLSKGSIVKRKSVISHRDNVCGRMQYASSIATEPTNTEIILIEQATDILLPLKTVENSTQTDWCNLMMEARQQRDGHYAFFLPSLETLKKYKLHVY